MKNYSKITPEGTRDYLFEESDALRAVERQLADLFKSRGYKKIVTPTIEFFDVFNRESAGTLPEALYTMTDAYGRLLVLRPDSTLPIARVAATRLKGATLPLRLYYNQNVFSRRPKLSGHNDETSQSGIELIGAKGLRADLEVITMAIQALELCGAPDYQIEIGHAGYFKSLCASLSCDEETVSAIYDCLESKNFVALNTVLDEIGQTPVTDAIRNLPRMFGDAQILSEARKVAKGKEAQAALDYLETLYARLQKAGYADRIILDLSLVHRTNYYTGIIFRGYTEGSGVTVLSGGRYDSLISEFGEDLPATGFGINTDDLARAKLRRGDVPKAAPADALVFGEDGFETEALHLQNRLIRQGKTCENGAFDTFEQAKAYAEECGIRSLYRVNADGVQEVVL